MHDASLKMKKGMAHFRPFCEKRAAYPVEQ
jgi:hypothetical protein